MNDDLDPELLAWFENDESLPPSPAFAEAIMASIDRDRRRTVIVWGLVVALIVVAGSFALQPALQALQLASGLLPERLVDVESDWLQQLLSPVNSVATGLAVGILLLRAFWRRITG